MSILTGKEALIALANGEEVEFQRESSGKWQNAMALNLFSFSNSLFEFRLKPRTITINGIEVPAPFEQKCENDCRLYVLDTRNTQGYDWIHSSHYKKLSLVWRTEEEIKQVVAALRQVFGGAQ